MKKEYIIPEMEVIKLNNCQPILAGSDREIPKGEDGDAGEAESRGWYYW